MNVTTLIPTMLELFTLILIGYYLGKKNVIDETKNAGLSYLVSNIFCPAMVIASVYSKGAINDDGVVLQALYLGIGFYVVLFFITILFFSLYKCDEDEKVIYKMSFLFANTGFLGYPLLRALYGEYAVFIFSVMHMGYNLFMYTYGIYLLQNSAKFQFKSMITPGLVCSIVSLFLYFFQIQLPYNVVDVFSLLGNASTPISMLVIGVSLSFIPLKDLFRNGRMYFIILLKLIVIPILCKIIIGFVPCDEFIRELIIISGILPAGSLIAIYANQYNRNGEFASALVIVSTFLSIITMPIMMFILI